MNNRIDPYLLSDAEVAGGCIFFTLNDGQTARQKLEDSSDYAILADQSDLGVLRFAGIYGFSFDNSDDIVPYPLASLFEDEEQVVEKK